jgi:hypothetical protein
MTLQQVSLPAALSSALAEFRRHLAAEHALSRHTVRAYQGDRICRSKFVMTDIGVFAVSHDREDFIPDEGFVSPSS